MARCLAFLLTAHQLLWMANGLNLVQQSSNILESKLYAEILRTKSHQNVIFSPISIDYILSGLSLGADDETRKIILEVIGLPSNESSIESEFNSFTNQLENDGHVSIASKIYYDQAFHIKDDYIRKMAAAFNVGVEAMDFQYASVEATNSINKWIEEKTNNTIKEFFNEDELTSDTKAVDINAIHFQSEWARPIQPSDTKKQIFYGLNGDHETVMMHMYGTYLHYAFDRSLNSHVVRLKYKGDFSMILIVPKEKRGIIEVDKMLQSQEAGSAPFTQKMEYRKIDLALPKFSDEFEIQLKDVFEQLGMGSIFLSNAYPRLTDDPGFIISQIKHKAIIRVDEYGTEAAAVTAVIAVGSSFIAEEEEIIKVEADHPFVYAIRHDPSDTLLFVGRHVK